MQHAFGLDIEGQDANQYNQFLHHKAHEAVYDGFEPLFLPDYLYDFQKALVRWAVKKGRAAIFADCGLGKTVQQLVWAENIVRETGGRVLILTPLAVSSQTEREAHSFGIDAKKSDGDLYRIAITNYEKLHYFDASDFTGVVCDESSILKNYSGTRRAEITRFMRKMSYRLLCTATAAPNDYIELGTSSEALGYMGHMDMLNRFFVNNRNNSATNRHWGQGAKWRFKGHAEEPFWRWVCSWARAIRKPSDLKNEEGEPFDDTRFQLPPLIEDEHTVEPRTMPDGQLFQMPAVGFHEQRRERRRTIEERCEKVADLVDHNEPALVWCNLNDEADLLEKIIPDAVQVAGSDSDQAKEDKLLAFSNEDERVLVTKPSIGAWGLNFQHCAHVTFFPSHSFEQYYQGVRRCWRFGQKRPVKVDLVTTEGGKRILDNLKRKSDNADKMFDRLVGYMHEALEVEHNDNLNQNTEIPTWL